MKLPDKQIEFIKQYSRNEDMKKIYNIELDIKK